MLSGVKKLLALLLLSGAMGALAVADVNGQAQVVPSVSAPSTSTRVGAAATTAAAVNRGSVGYRAPVGGFYGGGFYPGVGNNILVQDPVSGYLNGAANVISSQADYLKSYQESELLKQDVKRSQLDTRKQTFEQWRYEQSMLPTAEELRQKQEKIDIDRARGNPPLTDILSATALNTLLDHIFKAHRVGVIGPTIPLDPDMVQHINLTDGRSNSGVGLMRDGGKLDWPFPLQKEWFDADRKQTEKLMAQAVTEARSGRVNAKTIQGLQDLEDSMRVTLKTHIHDLTPTQGVNARRYLNELHDTVITLQDPNVTKYASGTWVARGNSVPELVDSMLSQGLRFAPASNGAESYYRVMYQKLRAYDQGLAQLASR
jgi:hypothetical protein